MEFAAKKAVETRKEKVGNKNKVICDPPSYSPHGMNATEVTCLCFVCFVGINLRVFSANRVDLGFLFHKFSNFPLRFSSQNEENNTWVYSECIRVSLSLIGIIILCGK